MSKGLRSAELVIDYPENGEAVRPGHYAIRVSGAPRNDVQISINGGSWQSCRLNGGYYWYDWSAEPGEFTVVARFKVGKAEWKRSKERRLTIL